MSEPKVTWRGSATDFVTDLRECMSREDLYAIHYELAGEVDRLTARRATSAMTPRTLRDEFAMAALTGLLSSWPYSAQLDREGKLDMMAARAYSLADAMLRARESDVRDTEPAPKPDATPAPQTALKMKDWTDHDWTWNLKLGDAGNYQCSACGVRRDDLAGPTKKCKPSEGAISAANTFLTPGGVEPEEWNKREKPLMTRNRWGHKWEVPPTDKPFCVYCGAGKDAALQECKR